MVAGKENSYLACCSAHAAPNLDHIRQVLHPPSKSVLLICLTLCFPGQVTNPELSYLTGTASGSTFTYTFHAIDTNGAAMTIGNDVVDLNVLPIGSVAGLPTTIPMTYQGSGQYQASYTGTIDTFYVSTTVTARGLQADYYLNADFSGAHVGTTYEQANFYYYWASGVIFGISGVADYVGVRWTGSFVPPHTDNFVFTIKSDDTFEWQIGSNYAASQCCGRPNTFAWYLEGGVSYPFYASLNNVQGPKLFQNVWYCSHWGYQTLSSDYFWQPEKERHPLGDPSKATIVYDPTTLQSSSYIATIQVRDEAGTINGSPSEVVVISLNRIGSAESYSATASHVAQGSYSASVVPLVAGDYNLVVTQNGVAINGSPFAVTVLCDFQAWSIPNMDVELTVLKTTSVAVAAKDNTYNFCEVSLTSDAPDMISFSSLSMTVLTADIAKNALTHTVELTASFVNQPAAGSQSRSFDVSVYGCDAHDINAFAIPLITVEMGYTETRTFAPTHTNNPKVPTLDCPLTLSTPDGTDLLSFTSFDMAVTTVDPYLHGSQTRTLRVTKSGEGFEEYLDITVSIKVIPSCALSTLQEVTVPPTMSTPMFGNVYQDLTQIINHAYVDIYPEDTCQIVYSIKTTGDTSYLECNSFDDADPTLTQNLHLYPYLFPDVGTYPTEVVASYLRYTDQVVPSNTLTSSTFQVIVEDQCEITSYVNNPAVSTMLETYYKVSDPEQTFDFEIGYEPAHCNYIQDYTIIVNGVIETPPWISIDQSSLPHRVNIHTDSAAYTGVYNVGIQAFVNTLPKYVSSVNYVFTVTIAFDNCSALVFDAVGFPDLTFEIADGAVASTWQFSTHTDSGGGFNCGPRQYKLIQSFPEFSFEGRDDLAWDEALLPYSSGDQLSFSFATTDPAAVGTHKMIILVETVDYPEWNQVIYHLEEFDLIVTASCLNTVLFYDAGVTPLKDYQVYVTQPVSTIDISPIKDNVSLSSSPFDGVTYCGSRTFSLVSVTSNDHDPVDESWLTFNSDDTFSIQNTLDSQWGVYTVTFGVELDLYPDFVRQDFSFTVEIVPNCLASQLSVLQSISFRPLYNNQIESVALTDYFTTDLFDAYDSFCGKLAFELDPSGPLQTYLNCDGISSLTFEPVASHATGVYSHTLRVQLEEYPLAFTHDEVFSVEIMACDILAFYADSVNAEAISPARENFFADVAPFRITVDPPMTFGFTFADFDVVQSTDCASSYDIEYSLFFEGVDVSLSLPVWVTTFDPAEPEVTVEFTELSQIGLKTLTVKSSLKMNPTPLMSTTQIYLPIEVQMDFCLFSNDVVMPTVPELQFTIDQDADPTLHVFEEMTTSGGIDCGPVDYNLSGDYPESILTVDSTSRTLSLSSTSGHDVGTYTVTMTGTLRNYPAISAQTSFLATVDSVCVNTVLLTTNFEPTVHYQGSLEKEVDLLVKDKLSFANGGDGFSLCGPRTYEIVSTTSYCVIDRYAFAVVICAELQFTNELFKDEQGKSYLKFPIASDDETFGTQLLYNYKEVVTLTVRLEEYPDVQPSQIVVPLFKMKNCSRQEVISRAWNEVKETSNIIGRAKISSFVDQYIEESQMFFTLLNEVKLSKQKNCGEIVFDLFYYDQSRDFAGRDPTSRTVMVNQDAIDRETPVPGLIFLKWSTSVQDVVEVYVGTDRPEDIGRHSFMLIVYLEDYPIVNKEEQVQLQIHKPVYVTINSEDILLQNKAPQWVTRPSCLTNVLHVSPEPPNPKSSDNYPFQAEFAAKDEDSHEPPHGMEMLAGDFRVVMRDNSVDTSQCTSCVAIELNRWMAYYEYVQGSVYPIDVFIGGILGWEFQQLFVEVSYTDGIETIAETLSVTFVPADVVLSSDCLTLDEILDELGLKEEVVEEVVSDFEMEVTESDDIEVEVQIEEKVDLSKFFKTFLHFMSQGVDLTEGSPNYLWVMQELRKLPFPFPLLVRVTYTGRAIVHFSRPLALPASQDLPEFVEMMIEEEWLRIGLQATENSSQSIGDGYFEPSFFGVDTSDASELSRDKTEAKTETQKRHLQTKTSQSGDEFAQIKDFRWAIAELSKTKLEVQLYFKKPTDISPEFKDRLFVNFAEPQKMFHIEDKDLDLVDTESLNQVKLVPRQLDEGKVESMETAASATRNFMQAATLASVGISALTSQSLQNLWGSISALQLMIHIPLNNISFPTVIEILFENLIKVVTFDFLESLDELGYGLEYETSPTMAYNDGFETLGYDGAEPIGLLGTINFLLAIALLQVIWFFTPRRLCLKRCARSRTGAELAAGLIRFTITLVFELLICWGAVMYPRENPTLFTMEEKVGLDEFLQVYTILIAVFTCAFLLLTVYATCRYMKVTVQQSQQIMELKNTPLRDAVRDGLIQKEQFAVNSQKMVEKPRTKSLTKKQVQATLVMTVVHEAELHKHRYFKEFFEGIFPRSKIAHLYSVVFLGRRVLIVVIAFAIDANPVLQVWCFMLLCILNLLFLLSDRIFADRWTNQLEIINDSVVYIASIHAIAYTETVQSSFEAFEMLGFTLGAIVVLNLFFNMGSMLLQSCRVIKQRLMNRYAKAQFESRKWDLRNDIRYTCNCTCFSCGAFDTKTTTIVGTKKTLNRKRTGEDPAFGLVLQQCEAFEDENYWQTSQSSSINTLSSNGDQKRNNQIHPFLGVRIDVDERFEEDKNENINDFGILGKGAPHSIDNLCLNNVARLDELERSQMHQAGKEMIDEKLCSDNVSKLDELERRQLHRIRMQVDSDSSQEADFPPSSVKPTSLQAMIVDKLFASEPVEKADADLEGLSRPNLSRGDHQGSSRSISQESCDSDTLLESTNLKQIRYRRWVETSGKNFDISSKSSHEAKQLRLIEQEDEESHATVSEDGSLLAQRQYEQSQSFQIFEPRRFNEPLRQISELASQEEDIEKSLSERSRSDLDDSVISGLSRKPLVHLAFF